MSLFDKLLGRKEKGPSQSPHIQGPELRNMALSTSAEQLGITPSETYPQIYAALMDFPLGEHIFSVFANTAGDVSLYSTSTFGIIGGGAHENVRNSGLEWVKFMGENMESSSPTTATD